MVILSLTSNLFTFILFGLATSLPMALTIRALMGAGNGNIGVIRTAVAELVPWKELQPRAFSIMPMVWNIGSILGPAIGGALSNPLKVKPRGGEEGAGMPQEGSLLRRFPFAVPNFLAAGLSVLSLVNCVLFLNVSAQGLRL
jgi:MFS family permease